MGEKVAVSSRVLKGEYRESVFLMRISQQVGELEGVKQASVMMASDTNKELLEDAGTLTDEIKEAGSNDLAIVVEAVDSDRAEEAISEAQDLLEEEAVEKVGEGERVYKTLNTAMESEPDSNLVLISVPGEFADREAERALNNDKHVMIFSDGVSVEDEVRLKRLGKEKDLLVMGPDCGTAIINGIGLGFANDVEKGPIGIVAAAGTGAQAVSSLVSAGPGISQVIGTGGRDLHDEVGGITMKMGIEALADDSETEVITLVSKPPSPKVMQDVLDLASEVDKPIVVNFLGGDPSVIEEAGLIPAVTLEDAAAKSIAVLEGEEAESVTFSEDLDEVKKTAEEEYSKLESDQKYIRALYSGGTYCSEAMLISQDLVGDINSNIPLSPDLKLEDSDESVEHSFVDMGEDEYTAELGKPHPMIYHGLRKDRILKEASDPETGVILLDVVLGYGADDDPAGGLAPAIEEAKEKAEDAERYLPVVASVCGTNQDPQNLEEQEKKLREVGVIVMPSNAQAAKMASLIATKGEVWDEIVG